MLNGKIPSKITLKVLDYFKTKDPDKFYINLVCIQLCMLSSKFSFFYRSLYTFLKYFFIQYMNLKLYIYKVKRKLQVSTFFLSCSVTNLLLYVAKIYTYTIQPLVLGKVEYLDFSNSTVFLIYQGCACTFESREANEGEVTVGTSSQTCIIINFPWSRP